MSCFVSGPCETPGQQADVGDQHPGDRAGDGRLDVLGQAATAAEPGECAFDDPSSRENFEAFRPWGTLHHFDRPLAVCGQRSLEFVACVAAIGEQMAQPWVEAA